MVGKTLPFPQPHLSASATAGSSSHPSSKSTKSGRARPTTATASAPSLPPAAGSCGVAGKNGGADGASRWGLRATPAGGDVGWVPQPPNLGATPSSFVRLWVRARGGTEGAECEAVRHACRACSSAGRLPGPVVGSSKRCRQAARILCTQWDLLRLLGGEWLSTDTRTDRRATCSNSKGQRRIEEQMSQSAATATYTCGEALEYAWLVKQMQVVNDQYAE